MDRTRRDRPEDKVRTSQLIQQLAAQRERKLQAATASSSTAHSTDDVVAASSIPLPGSFDEEDTAHTPAGKPRSRLVRQDRAKQQTPHQTHGSGVGDVDGLADLLQGVGLSSNSGSNSSAYQPAQQPPQQKQGSNGGSSSGEDAIKDEEVDSDGSSAAAAATQHRRTAGPASSRRTPAAAHTPVPDSDHEVSDAAEQEDGVASVDSAADSDGDQAAASSSNAQQQPAPGTSSSSSTATAAPAAEPLVLEGGFRLDGEVARKLYPHQIQGVKWLWSLHRYA